MIGEGISGFHLPADSSFIVNSYGSFIKIGALSFTSAITIVTFNSAEVCPSSALKLEIVFTTLLIVLYFLSWNIKLEQKEIKLNTEAQTIQANKVVNEKFSRRKTVRNCYVCVFLAVKKKNKYFT